MILSENQEQKLYLKFYVLNEIFYAEALKGILKRKLNSDDINSIDFLIPN